MRTVTIGRDRACDIVIDDEYASPRHCELTEREPGQWTVRDLVSTNGTYVRRGSSGFRLTMGASAPLLAGDELMVGRTMLPPFTPERIS